MPEVEGKTDQPDEHGHAIRQQDPIDPGRGSGGDQRGCAADGQHGTPPRKRLGRIDHDEPSNEEAKPRARETFQDERWTHEEPAPPLHARRCVRDSTVSGLGGMGTRGRVGRRKHRQERSAGELPDPCQRDVERHCLALEHVDADEIQGETRDDDKQDSGEGRLEALAREPEQQWPGNVELFLDAQ